MKLILRMTYHNNYRISDMDNYAVLLSLQLSTYRINYAVTNKPKA